MYRSRALGNFPASVPVLTSVMRAAIAVPGAFRSRSAMLWGSLGRSSQRTTDHGPRTAKPEFLRPQRHAPPASSCRPTRATHDVRPVTPIHRQCFTFGPASRGSRHGAQVERTSDPQRLSCASILGMSDRRFSPKDWHIFLNQDGRLLEMRVLSSGIRPRSSWGLVRKPPFGRLNAGTRESR
jgi:hypothetical protein